MKTSHQYLLSLKDAIRPYMDKVANHPLYGQIRGHEDLNCFLEHHIFAVWDFMSLLKGLQRGLTCVQVPWLPVGNPITRRLINQIVVEEESDLDEDGESASHFEMYLEAMRQCGASLGPVERFIGRLTKGVSVEEAICDPYIPPASREFVEHTWSVVASGELHRIAACFTFGREEVIPEMFMAIVEDLENKFPGRYGKLRYYLERHIELDGDSHSHLACQMLEELCGLDEQKWADCEATAIKSLEARAKLWDGVLYKTAQVAS